MRELGREIGIHARGTDAPVLRGAAVVDPTPIDVRSEQLAIPLQILCWSGHVGRLVLTGEARAGAFTHATPVRRSGSSPGGTMDLRDRFIRQRKVPRD
jgi:hypothetical protein